ncbi:MAG TPA: DUF6305 family protein [Spirochaetales bacterium]|nr:DUF6305 family protein [Spirochaetales bacterium]HRY55565.1 DUF6305 family protein [Spirochaetia bacterium]HRZ65393.1 DUF6305 family protein [Spirochaetia bacterium]
MKQAKLKVFSAFLCLLAYGLGAAGAQEPPKASLPMLSTSAGQSSGAVIVNALCDRSGLAYDYCDVPTAEQLAAGVGLGDFKTGEGFHLVSKSGAAKGTPYKTVIFAVGASLKGMGASGLSIDTEIARVKKLVDYCKKNKIMVVAVHAEGKSRRGKPGSDNELIIDAIVPSADYVIVTADGNFDGRFDAIAKKSGAPLSVIKQSTELTAILQKMFK